MASRTIQDQVQALLDRSFSESKVRGTASPDIEARAVFDAISLTLLLNPRAVYYIYFLARNGLTASIQNEILALTTLRQDVVDLGNPSYKIQDTKHLESAKTALLQINSLQKIDSKGPTFGRFSTAIDNFLNKTIGNTVRQPGKLDFIRPSDEAAIDFISDLIEVESLHSDFLDRLYALSVAIQNFQTSPISTILGLTTASRVSGDIQDIIDQISSDSSSQSARDYVTRLVSDRASLKVIGSPPSFGDPIIDSINKLPKGYSVQAKTPLVAPSVTSSIAPFSLSASSTITITVGIASLGPFNFPQVDANLFNKAYIASSVALPTNILLPANSYLFLTIGTTNYKVLMNSGGSPLSQTLSQVITTLNNSFISQGIPAIADEFILPGTKRLIINTTSNQPITIRSIFQDSTAYGGSTSGGPGFYTNSCDVVLALTVDKQMSPNIVSLSDAEDYFTQVFSSIVSVSSSNQSIVLTALANSPGTSLVITSAILGIGGTFTASADSISFFGLVPSVTSTTDPINMINFINIGDTVQLGTASSTIQRFDGTSVQLSSSVPIYSGNVIVTSSIDLVYPILQTSISSFLESWLSGPYSEDLNTLNLTAASLLGNPTNAERNAVLVIIDDLLAKLNSLNSTITGPSTLLPTGAATNESKIVSGIVNTLTERKYDRAVDLLLRAKVQETLGLGHSSASYANNLMQTAGDIARTDLVFPNQAADERSSPSHTQDRTGL